MKFLLTNHLEKRYVIHLLFVYDENGNKKQVFIEECPVCGSTNVDYTISYDRSHLITECDHKFEVYDLWNNDETILVGHI